MSFRRIAFALMLVALAGAAWLTYQPPTVLAEHLCHSRHGRWASNWQSCIERNCYETASCGHWANPIQSCPHLTPLGSIDEAYFWLGQPDRIEGDRHIWHAAKGESLLIAATFSDGLLQTLECPVRDKPLAPARTSGSEVAPTSAREPVAKLLGPSPTVIAGWEQLRWGMTETQLQQVLGKPFSKEHSASYVDGYSDHGIGNTMVGGVTLQSHFIMDKGTKQLIRIRFHSDESPITTPRQQRYLRMREALTRQFGSVGESHDASHEIAGKRQMELDTKWSYPSAEIELMYRWDEYISNEELYIFYRPAGD